MSLIACKQKLFSNREGHSGQGSSERYRWVEISYWLPGVNIFFLLKADSSDCFFSDAGEILSGKVAFFSTLVINIFRYMSRSNIIEWLKRVIITISLRQKESYKMIRNICVRFTLDSAYNRLCQGYDTIPISTGKLYFPID